MAAKNAQFAVGGGEREREEREREEGKAFELRSKWRATREAIPWQMRNSIGDWYIMLFKN